MNLDLRRRVLNASLLLVAERGPEALSLREVARQAGVSHQAPYKHFGDREGVIAALVEEGFISLSATLSTVSESANLETRIATAGTAYVDWALAYPGYLRLLFRPDLLSLDKYPQAAAAAHQAWLCLQHLVVDLPGDPEENAALLWSTVHGLSILLLDGPLPSRDSRLNRDALAKLLPARLAALMAFPRPKQQQMG